MGRGQPDSGGERVAGQHRPDGAESGDDGEHEDQAGVPGPPRRPRGERDDAQGHERQQHDREVYEQRMDRQAEELIKHGGRLRTNPVRWL